MLDKKSFQVLAALLAAPGASQREISAAKDLSIGSVNAAYKALIAEGLISEGKVTNAGISALEPYKVDNAVIMAAGLSSRFAPISYEKPKGLLKVRGEVLIERQIEQLKAAGVPAGLIRLSCGLENKEDLIADLTNALEAIR